MLKVYDPLEQVTDDASKQFRERSLRHLASELMEGCGYCNENDLHDALLRSFAICCTMRIPIAENFRKVYRYDNNLLQVDWQMSDLGCYLLLINGNSCNPNVAKAQLSALLSALSRK